MTIKNGYDELRLRLVGFMGVAAERGATKEELAILEEAFDLIEKYQPPIKED